MLSRRRFDVHEYHRMGRAGILTEDDRVELIDGEIVQKHVIGSRHFASVTGLTNILTPLLSGRALVSVQNPVRLDRYSEPEPDVAVLRLREDLYAEGLPEVPDTLLIIEVADSSLRIDRMVKLPLYAAAGIPELWLVDLTNDAVEIHREPEESAFGICERLREGSVSPLAFPDLAIDVRQILPRAG